MTLPLFPLIAYVLISTFTPGPSNISSASIAVLHGYKQTLRYQAGLAMGVFVMMLLSGWISTAVLGLVPVLEPVLRYGGAAYILYLALNLLRASYNFADQPLEPLGFGHGFILQVLNPKLIIYAFTLFSAFLAPITGNVILLVLATSLLAATSFGATSVWALCGTAIKRYLRQPRLKFVINLLLALSLGYTALTLTGLTGT